MVFGPCERVPGRLPLAHVRTLWLGAPRMAEGLATALGRTTRMMTSALKISHARAAASPLKSLDDGFVVPARAGQRAVGSSTGLVDVPCEFHAACLGHCDAHCDAGSWSVVSLRDEPRCRAASSSSVEPPPSSSSPLEGGGGDRGAKAHLRRFPAPCSAAVHDHRHDRARLYRHQHLRAAFSLYRRRARFRDDISSRGGVGVATYTRDRQRRAKRVNRGRRVAGICPTDSSVHPRGQKAHGVARPHVCRSASAVEGASGPASCPKQRAARWHKLNRDERALLCGPPLPTEPRTTPQSQSAGASFYRRKTAPSG
ncbi:hypothetical protein M885DRAFT_156138 [Pelagophyceae sp. CCMP2097]|nr:hypothetical protein M885DRAFT_156138 [Pelagophyceae sp. CCMP2097]